MYPKNLLVTGAIVLYENSFEVVNEAIKSFLSTDINVKLFLIDNSLDDKLKGLAQDCRIEYFKLPKNIGFGAAHNIAFKKAFELNSNYHLVLNPDIYFDPGTIEKIVDFMESNHDVGHLMPKVLYPDVDCNFYVRLILPFLIYLHVGFYLRPSRNCSLSGWLNMNVKIVITNLSCMIFPIYRGALCS